MGDEENQWVEFRREKLDQWGTWTDEVLMSNEGVVARYTPDGRLIDPGERNYSKNEVVGIDSVLMRVPMQSLPDGEWSDSIPFVVGNCGCIACNQIRLTKGKGMDRDQVARVAEAIGSSLMPDNSQWINRFTVPSSSSSKVYTVAQRRNDGVWGCSCPAWINRRHCKHLVAILKQLADVQLAAATDPAVLSMLRSARTAYLDLDAIPGGSNAKAPTYTRHIDL